MPQSGGLAALSPAKSTVTALLDALMTQVEEGRGGQAALQLAGMLDAAHASASFSHWAAALHRHPIRAFLMAMSASSTASAPPAPFDHFGFVRGEASRQALTQHCLAQAMAAGRRIALIAPHDAYPPFDSPPAIRRETDWRALPSAMGQDGSAERFDCILLPMLPDRLASAELAEAMAALTPLLADGGTITLSCFAPAYLGQGWQAAVLGGAPHCHDETALTAIAHAAHLSIDHRRDASNTLIWANLRRLTPVSGGARP